MSSEITLGAFLRRRVAVLLLALLSAWLVATPSQAAPHRAAQCAACAAEASIRNAVADQLELRQRARDAAATALAKTERDYDEVMRQRDLTAKAAEAVVASGIGMPIDTKAVANLEEQVRNARAALNYAKQRYARTMTEFTLALNELQRVTLLLIMCEAKNCPDTTGTAAQTLVAPQPAAVAAPPGIRLDPRTAACPACAAAATRRNDLAQSVMNGEMTVQSIRNRMFINQYRLRQAEEALAPVKAEADELVALINGGVAVRPEVVRSVAARKNDREGDVSNLRHDYGELLKELQAAMDAQALVYARYLQADAALTQCERQMCGRPQADAAPVTSVAPATSTAPVQTATPAGQPAPTGTTTTPPPPPPPTTPLPGDRRQSSRAEVQIFGGAAVSVARLNLTGVDNFFGPGAELIDRRSSDVTKVSPALGMFARVYVDLASDAPTPAPRVFFTGGMLFTPGRGNLGFDSTGVNTVPRGNVRTETSRSFLAPIMAGLQMPIMVGTTQINFDFMAGAALGHETTRVILFSEGGAPGGAGGSAENSGFFVDPAIGFAVSAPVAHIEGLGPVKLGIMGLAVIGTGGRSARVGSTNFLTQGYTGESRRGVDWFIGATLTLGVF